MVRIPDSVDVVLGVLGIALLIGWFVAIVYLFTLGETETPVLLLALTAVAFVVIFRNE